MISDLLQTSFLAKQRLKDAPKQSSSPTACQMAATLRLLFAWAYLFVYMSIYTPILVYHLRRFSQRKIHIVYSLRYSNITVLQCSIYVIKLFIHTAWGMTYLYGLYGADSIIEKIIIAVDAYVAAFFLYCFVWKFWLLRYSILLHSALLNSEWKSIINSKGYTQHSSFYVNHRGTLCKS